MTTSVPGMSEFFLPVLRLLAEGATNARACLPGLQKEFGLTSDEMAELIDSGHKTRVFDRADWAIFHMMKAGLVHRLSRGVYGVSAEGRSLLSSGIERLDSATIRSLPAYRASVAQGGATRGTEVATPAMDSSVANLIVTPQESIEAAFAVIETDLVDDILAALQAVTPARFEQLIVDLLLAMGYGGGDRSMGERIGRSGDGGIDGIVNEDALGLDAVYIQAKRYAPDSKVGRPALQAFVGSLTGEGATKGVFVTTSDFSREAKDYLNRVQHRIVLINGDRLARLMIQHEVGVRARKTYVLRSVDEDYFSEA